MAKRSKMSSRHSRANFSRGNRTNRRNSPPPVLRGGMRF